MARIIDTITSARESGEWPENLDEIFNEDVNDAVSPHVAKIGELESTISENGNTIAELQNSLNAAKAHNYDLMNAAGTGAGESNEENLGNDSADESPRSIDELFN